MTELERIESASGKILVIYDTLFGNTEKIAKALARGYQRHFKTICLNVKDVDIGQLSAYGLIAVGAPTHAFSASKPMKEFLANLEGKNLTGRYGFAFDTRRDIVISGSAAKYIENKLRGMRLEIVKPRQSAIVTGDTRHSELVEGEEERFETLGDAIGASLKEK